MTTTFTGPKPPTTLHIILSGVRGWILSPFSWSKWDDITTFHYADGYLLQGRMNRISNAKQFRITRFRKFNMLQPTTPLVPVERIKEIGS